MCEIVRRPPIEREVQTVVCSDCQGTGQLQGQRCGLCFGDGYRNVLVKRQDIEDVLRDLEIRTSPKVST